MDVNINKERNKIALIFSRFMRRGLRRENPHAHSDIIVPLDEKHKTEVITQRRWLTKHTGF